MIDTIGRWFKGLFSSSSETQEAAKGSSVEEARSLSDSDYEFLFEQLLEGVGHGWQAPRIQRFFEQLGEQGRHDLWIDWMHRFATKVLASPSPQKELSERLILLANQTQYLPKLNEVGAMAYAIAQKLQQRQSQNPIWEYEGADSGGNASEQGQQVETLTMDELLARLQQDEALARQVALQLGLESSDPSAILKALIDQAQAGSEGEMR
ncbi:hypothetical protein IQ249_24410 [Lusitaniella coriacea LEGE 07157]|uniref:Uncharacterized protein n=1 Tax=Lusitaniella coriacea LEGE 07157 TaxID=945747 RepID=A0A8J7E397_9CYAN|nr:hypothetical protein [Lusitaniella coriacea]MBE9119037.1 hypothetical protein [Lusitaniella coriacea LEGE 07157]